MRHKGKWASALAGIVLSTPAMSQDLFRSTNTTVHSYNYLEVQYLLDTEASPPLLATLLIDVSDRWSVKAEYLNQDFDFILLSNNGVDQLDLTVGVQSLSVGGLYHQPFARMKQSDWIAGFMVGAVEGSLEVPVLGFDEKVVDLISLEVYAGVRRTFSSKLEGEVALNLYRDENRDTKATTTEVHADVKLVYRAFDAVDVALAANEVGEANLIGLGLRYTW